MTVPLSAGVFGAIGVKTAGGTSASFTVNLSSIDSVAASGTPANAALASANANAPKGAFEGCHKKSWPIAQASIVPM